MENNDEYVTSSSTHAETVAYEYPSYMSRVDLFSDQYRQSTPGPDTPARSEILGDVQFYYKIEQSPIEVEGNVLATGNPKVDRKAERAVIYAVNSSDIWMWAYVEVVACLRREDREVTAWTSLGGSWAGEAEFLSCTFDNMCDEALDALERQLAKGAVI